MRLTMKSYTEHTCTVQSANELRVTSVYVDNAIKFLLISSTFMYEHEVQIPNHEIP